MKSPMKAMKANHAALASKQAELDAELVEKLGGLIEVSPDLVASVRSGTYDRSDLVPPLRMALFTVLEHHQVVSSPFRRWKPGDHELEHTRSCKKGKESWAVAEKFITVVDAAAGDRRWFVLRELQRRVDHLNQHTMPALRMGGVASVLTPRVHTGTCSTCNRVAIATSVTVEVMWSGLSMRREYVL